jgi:PAS domain S-box-containing protein
MSKPPILHDIPSHKRGKEALLRHDTKFQLLMRGVKDYAIVMLDPQGRVTTWNEGAAHIEGYCAEEIIGQHFSRFYTPEAVEAGRPSLELKIATEQGRCEEEGWRVRKDGSQFWANVVLTSVRGDNGQLGGVSRVTRDITARKGVEEALRQSEEKFRLLVQGVKDYAILMLDPQGRVTTWNEGAERIKGYRPEEIIGEHFSRFYTPEAVAAGHPSWELRIATEQGRFEEEGWRVRKDGSRFWASVVITALRNEIGQLRGFGKVTRDITDRKQAESKLRLLTERLSLATAVAKVGVWEWDLAGASVAWDKTMFEIYGLPPTEPAAHENWSAPMPYERWSSAVYPDDLLAAEAALQKTIKDKGQTSSEFRVTLPDGEVRNILAMQKAVTDQHGNVARIVGVNIDITERKREEEAREQRGKDQLRLKDEFLSQVSHEIRSPLSAIMQFTAIVLDGLAGKINDEQREYQQIVLQNARQLQSMIDDLLEVTRLENGRLRVGLESLSASEIVADTLNTHHGNACAKGVSLSCELSPNLPAAYADPVRFRQILSILTDNAIKFTPFGGTVKIGVRPWGEAPEFLCIEVSDTGTGIDSKHVEKIFERLYQTPDSGQLNRQGLGLGLFICKELVTRQGGEIWVQSTLQEGSTFSFTLPIFSLKKLMAPLLKKNKWPHESAAVIAVDIHDRKGPTSKQGQKEGAREIRELIRSCLMPNLDVLLPQMTAGGGKERFLVAAFADEQGVSVLSKRIREQLEGCSQIAGSGSTVTVFHTVLNPFVLNEGESMDDIVATLVANLDEAIRSPNSLGEVDD